MFKNLLVTGGNSNKSELLIKSNYLHYICELLEKKIYNTQVDDELFINLLYILELITNFQLEHFTQLIYLTYGNLLLNLNKIQKYLEEFEITEHNIRINNTTNCAKIENITRNIDNIFKMNGF